MMLDSGSQVSCLNWGTVKMLGLEGLMNPEEIGYEGYGELTAKMMGALAIKVSYHGSEVLIEFMVSEQGTDLLVYNDCEALKM